MPRGTLETETAYSIPAYPPVYKPTKVDFSDVDALLIQYSTSSGAVKHLIPKDFDIDVEPLVTSTAVRWGFSPFGAYTEYMTMIEVTRNVVKYDFSLELILDNESAIFMGREQLGFPEVFGHVVFNPSATTDSNFHLGHVERPVGHKIIHFGFRPESKVQSLGPVPASGKRVINLRIFPSPVVGQRPTVREYVSPRMNFTEAEVWTGAGSLVFSGTSDFNISQKLPIVRYQGAKYLRKASGHITTTPEVFSI